MTDKDKPDTPTDGEKSQKPATVASKAKKPADKTEASSQATDKESAAKEKPKAQPEPAAQPAASARPQSSSRNPTDGQASGGPWKIAALVLFVIAGLAIAGALDYRSDLNKALTEMARLQSQVTEERIALKAAQEKFQKESKEIAAAVEKAKKTLTETEASITTRSAEAQELETKLSGLHEEIETSLKAASEAAGKQAAAQATLDKLLAEHANLSGKVKTARGELATLEKDADELLKGLKGSFSKIREALDKL